MFLTTPAPETVQAEPEEEFELFPEWSEEMLDMAAAAAAGSSDEGYIEAMEEEESMPYDEAAAASCVETSHVPELANETKTQEAECETLHTKAVQEKDSPSRDIAWTNSSSSTTSTASTASTSSTEQERTTKKMKMGRWLASEDKVLMESQRKWGNSWVKIAALLPGRSDNAVKNRWKTITRKCAKRGSDLEDSCASSPDSKSNVSLYENARVVSQNGSLTLPTNAQQDTTKSNQEDKIQNLRLPKQESTPPTTPPPPSSSTTTTPSSTKKKKSKKGKDPKHLPPSPTIRKTFKSTDEIRRKRALTRPSRSKAAIAERQREKADAMQKECTMLEDLFATKPSDSEKVLIRRAYVLGLVGGRKKVMKNVRNHHNFYHCKGWRQGENVSSSSSSSTSGAAASELLLMRTKEEVAAGVQWDFSENEGEDPSEGWLPFDDVYPAGRDFNVSSVLSMQDGMMDTVVL